MARESSVVSVMLRWGFREWTPEVALGHRPDLHAYLSLAARHYRYQLERGDGGLVHYQIFAQLKLKARPGTLARALNDQFRGVHVEAAHDPSAASAYCTKTESRIAGPWTCDCCSTESKSEYKADYSEMKWTKWQLQVLEYISRKPHDRELLVLLDTEGSRGKSTFADFLEDHHGAVVLNFGSAPRLLKAVAQQPPSKLYVVDLTRAKGKDVGNSDLAQAVESIKNGRFLSTFGSVDRIKMPRPHVIVFTNDVKYLQRHVVADRITVIDLAPYPKFEVPKSSSAEIFGMTG